MSVGGGLGRVDCVSEPASTPVEELEGVGNDCEDDEDDDDDTPFFVGCFLPRLVVVKPCVGKVGMGVEVDTEVGTMVEEMIGVVFVSSVVGLVGVLDALSVGWWSGGGGAAGGEYNVGEAIG